MIRKTFKIFDLILPTSFDCLPSVGAVVVSHAANVAPLRQLMAELMTVGLPSVGRVINLYSNFVGP